MQVVKKSQKALKFHLVVGGGKVLESLNFGGVRLHTFEGEYCSIEADLWQLYPAPAAVLLLKMA